MRHESFAAGEFPANGRAIKRAGKRAGDQISAHIADLYAGVRLQNRPSLAPPPPRRIAGRQMYARRRLAAILAADLAGYSRFMELDEERTLARIKGLKAEVVNPQITEYRGRLVKTTGDGLLADFESAVDALNCACEIQRIVGERNAALLSDDRLEFRIGINVGEIIAEDGDIFGDSVNVAARLEGLAEPGGICLAAHVREYLVGRPEFIFEDLGEQFLKNIQRPIRVLRVRADALPRSRTGTLRQHNW